MAVRARARDPPLRGARLYEKSSAAHLNTRSRQPVWRDRIETERRGQCWANRSVKRLER